MIRPSKYAKAVVHAYNQGYRVIDGQVISPHRDEPLKVRKRGNSNYYSFGIRVKNVRYRVYVHQLIALQKFGKKALTPGIQVRHYNGNSLDNSYSNIGIGDGSANEMDKPAEERQERSIKAASRLRKYTDEEIDEMRRLHADGWSYSQLMEKFNVPSKGSMSNIINNDYTTTK